LGNGVIPVPGTEKNQAGKLGWILNDNTTVNIVFPARLPHISNYEIRRSAKTTKIKKNKIKKSIVSFPIQLKLCQILQQKSDDVQATH
jgi:hypothetical protein